VEILSEVKEFLAGLALELPLVFKPAPAPRAPRVKKPERHVPFKGRDLPLWIVDDEPRPKRSEIEETPEGLRLIRGEDGMKPQEILREWLIDRAREAFAESLARWTPRMGVAPSRVTIRDQRSVWGSMSRAGGLNLNWRVIMAPPETLDYLIIHELAHMKEMNHSKRFWAIVAEHCPGWKTHRDWLRDHSRRLKAAVRRG
jgi:predicted metal-dependent hydrolase